MQGTADSLFINMTKICAQQQKSLQVLSIELLKELSEYTKSGFFATQTLCQIIERDQSLYPQAMRALACLSQVTSRPEIEKLINRAFLDVNKKRSIAAAVLAANRQNIQLPLQNAERILGSSGYIAMLNYDEGTIQALTAKYNTLANQYSRVAIIEKFACNESVDDRKKLQKLLTFLPKTKKEVQISQLAPYLETIKQIAKLQFESIRPYLNQVFGSFAAIFDTIKQPHIQIAFLRQILKVHQAAVQENVPGSELQSINEVLDKNQHSLNQTISTLCSINLIMSTYDMDAIMKLVDMLPNLTHDLKRSALKLLSGLSVHERLFSNIIPMYKRFLELPDIEIKSCGLKALSDILGKTQDEQLRSTLASIVLSNLDAAGQDQELKSLLCSQLSHLEVDNYDEAVEIAASLWQRCMLDGLEMRMASVQALHGITKKFKQLSPIIEKVLSLQNDVFIKNSLVERDDEIIRKYNEKLQFFNPDDIIANTKNVIKNNFQVINFTKKVQESKKSQSAEQHRKDEVEKNQQMQSLIQKNPNFKNFKITFTNGQNTVLTNVQHDFVLEVFKVYYFNGDGEQSESEEQSGELMYYFKTYSDDQVEFTDQSLKIEGKMHKFIDGELVYVQKFDDINEASLSQLRFYYTLDDQKASMYVDDIETSYLDLTSSSFQGDIEQFFQSQESHYHEYHLSSFNSLDELIDVMPTITGLSMHNLKVEGKKSTFTMAGHIYGCGKVTAKFQCRLVTGKGIKLKIDCRGPGAEIILKLLSN